jgi:Sulfatase
VSWDGGGSVVQVFVSIDKQQPILFAGDARAGSQEATWIDRGVVYEFRIYAGGRDQPQLASVTVERQYITPLESRSGWLLGLCLFTFAIVISMRATLVLCATMFAVVTLLSWVNTTKIELTQAPLTVLDFKIALANPRGLWTAMSWEPWTMWLAGGLIVLTGSLLTYRISADLIRGIRLWRQRSYLRLVTAVTALGTFVYLFVSVGPLLATRSAHNPDLWEAKELAAYSTAVGIVPFLLFSYHLESRDTGLFYDFDLTGSLPTAAELAQAAARHITPRQSHALAPNIVIMFGESTFDPDRAFRLNDQVSSPLFTAQPDTQMLSTLHVNVVGGGSWVAEFESLVGVDSRLFGYSGFYTHSALSPFVHRTLATYLNGKGYDTAVYYAWDGSFYNARRAFGSYGFKRFYDAGDLGFADLPSVDRDIAATMLAKAQATQREPFFSFVGLGENHSPHPCRNFRRSADFSVEFASTDDFRMNCELNEYVLRLKSTSDAFELWDKHLRSIEASTGRPYVLMMFGDHQPHTFTSAAVQSDSPRPFVPGSSTNVDYSSTRTGAPLRETFVHVRSSISGVIRCCTVAPPVTLLPTILSAFVASDLNDLYLPVNFYFYEKCGTDLLGRDASSGLDNPAGGSSDVSGRAGCTTALARGLAALRLEGVF